MSQGQYNPISHRTANGELARNARVQRLVRRRAPTIADWISARAHEHGWYIQFYPHGADIAEFADKLLALPNMIVLDHFASVKAEKGLGTDWPHVNMDGRNVPNDSDLVDLIPEWIEDAMTQKQILADNPRQLYGFPAAI